jgi:hypothetical protein
MRNEFRCTQMTEPVENSRREARDLFARKSGAVTVKLAESSGEASLAYKLAARGGGLHQICLSLLSSQGDRMGMADFPFLD